MAHRAKIVSSNQEALDQKLLHIRRALQACQFPNWALNQLQHEFPRNNQPSLDNNHNSKSTNNNITNSSNRSITIVIPYIHGTGENSKRFASQKVYKYTGIQVHFKGTNSLITLLVTTKDKDPTLHKCGVIYHFKCPHINCPKVYIGESGRALGERIKEHLKALSPIHQHSSSTGHPLSQECFNIIHLETQGSSRNIKEAMFTHVNDPSLNRNPGKYQLPHVWDSILQDTPALQVNQSSLTPPTYWDCPFPWFPTSP